MKLSILIFFILSLVSLVPQAQAGVFNIPHFVAPTNFALGLEPEFYMTQGTGLGVNLRFTQGISDLSNVSAILGTGGGARQFRFGGNFTFDFFPDVEGQPGIGIAAQALFVQTPVGGTLELQGIPYIHKNLKTDSAGEIEPFLAVPIGVSMLQGTQVISTLTVGAQFHQSAHVSTIIELGVGLSNASTYLSGGIVYYN